MSTHELRYRGELLGFHPSEDEAYAHAREHHGLDVDTKKDTHVADPEALSIEPRRPVSLHVRGNLVDTFHTLEGGREAVKRMQESAKARAERDPRLVALLPADEDYVLSV